MPKSTKKNDDAITMDLNDDKFSQLNETLSVNPFEIENLKKDITPHKKKNQSAIMLGRKNRIDTSMRSSYYPKHNRTFNLSTTTEKKRVSDAMKRFEQMNKLYQQEGIIQTYIDVPNIYKILTKHNIDGVEQASYISQSKGYWEWLKQQRGNKSISEYKKANGLSTMELRAKYLDALMAGTFKPTKQNDFDRVV